MKLFKRAILSTLLMLMLISIPAVPVFAQTATAKTCQDRAQDGISFFLSFPTWYKYLELDANCEIAKFSIPGDIWRVAIAIVEILLRIAGMVAFVYAVFAGFKFVMSRGNPGEAAKARQTIIDACIGLVIASLATVLVAFLGNTLK